MDELQVGDWVRRTARGANCCVSREGVCGKITYVDAGDSAVPYFVAFAESDYAHFGAEWVRPEEITLIASEHYTLLTLAHPEIAATQLEPGTKPLLAIE